MATVLTLQDIWDLQDKLIRSIEPGLAIDDVLDGYSICVRCKTVWPDDTYCSCDDDS